MRQLEIRRVLGSVRDQPVAQMRGLMKQLFVFAAARRIDELPRRELVDLLSRPSHTVRIAARESRHAWSFGAPEQIVLQMLLDDRAVRTAFEIGTFNGGTTALIAETLPADGRVVTLDLPDEAFDETQRPDSFSSADVGAMHRASTSAHKVEQLRVDSLLFDPTPWRTWADLVLVDGAHDYDHGFADTKTALQVVKPGGLVIWDDFEPYWHGLVSGVLDASEGRKVERLTGLPIAILLA